MVCDARWPLLANVVRYGQTFLSSHFNSAEEEHKMGYDGNTEQAL